LGVLILEGLKLIVKAVKFILSYFDVLKNLILFV